MILLHADFHVQKRLQSYVYNITQSLSIRTKGTLGRVCNTHGSIENEDSLWTT